MFLFITQFTVPIAVSSVAYTMIINKLATRGWSHKEEVKDLNVRKMLKNLFLGSRRGCGEEHREKEGRESEK